MQANEENDLSNKSFLDWKIIKVNPKNTIFRQKLNWNIFLVSKVKE
jgi:hypothetical protein